MKAPSGGKMSYLGRLRRFLLFAATSKGDRKVFLGSFDSRADAIFMGQIKKATPGRTAAMSWQVIDNQTSETVAEDPGD
jgi:hypothetical protein